MLGRRATFNQSLRTHQRDQARQNRKIIPTGDYTIGYGKPPVATRFRPGVSGNPTYRSKEPSTNVLTVVAVLDETHTVIERGKKRRMRAEEIMLRKQQSKAMNGELRATTFLLNRRDQHLAQIVAPQSGTYDLSVLTNEDLVLMRSILAKAVRD